MKTLAEFIRTTLIGGVLVLVPIYVLALLTLKVLSQAKQLANRRGDSRQR